MKQSNLSFADGFLGIQADVARSRGAKLKAFDWAAPTLIISWDGKEQEEVECSIEKNKKFNSNTK